MQGTFFDYISLSSELQLQALEGFADWYQQEYGIALLGEQNKVPKGNYKETIQKIASILVDMVIDEQNSLKRYD